MIGTSILVNGSLFLIILEFGKNSVEFIDWERFSKFLTSLLITTFRFRFSFWFPKFRVIVNVSLSLAFSKIILES